jgi:hypothetical protein
MTLARFLIFIRQEVKPLKLTAMKKLSLILLPLMLMLGFTACDDDVDQVVRVYNESYSTLYVTVAPVEFAEDWMLTTTIEPGTYVDFRVAESLLDDRGRHFTYVHFRKTYSGVIDAYPVDLSRWRPEVIIDNYGISLPR